MPTGLELIAKERARQVVEEGFDAAHDAKYKHLELVRAGVSYACVPVIRGEGREQNIPAERVEEEIAIIPEEVWPWDVKWWKPGTDKQCLIKAGALIAAQLDKLIAEEEHGEA